MSNSAETADLSSRNDTNNQHFIRKCSMFDKKLGKKLIDSIVEVVEGFQNDSNIDSLNEKDAFKAGQQQPGELCKVDLESIKNLTISEKFHCATCNSSFTDREEQIEHYKCDLHLFNLKQKLKGKPSVSAEEFENLSDISSISGGSDSEDEGEIYSSRSSSGDEDDADYSSEKKSYAQIARNKPKISFKLNDSTVLVMLRCVVHGKKNIPENHKLLLEKVKSINAEDKWCIILVAAGHFAAAVFKGDQPVVHKTFHRYVVRAKRGTVQSQHDSSGKFAKSAGANIRRQQESAFKDEIRALIGTEWKAEISSCKCVFIRVPQYNRGVLINTSSSQPSNNQNIAPFDKSDTRLRQIPFMTFRPTLNEIKRVHNLLSKIENYNESYLEFTSKFAKSEPKASQETAGEGTKSKKKSGKSQPSKPSKSAKDQPVKSEEAVSDEKSFEKVELEETDESSGAEEDDEPSKTTNDDFIQSLLGDHLKLFNEIYTACFTNNRSKLNQTLTDFINSDQEKAEVEKRGQLVERLLNKRLNKDNGFTLLHLTSQLGHFECIRELLLNGASPALADLTRQHRLPYFLSANKQTRDQYRLFVNDFPERYDYEAAKINDPLSVEKLAERAEKDKEKKRKKNKLKKQRDAQVKQKLTLQESELNERKKFLELTDQEKKKLILDRNFLNLLPLDAKKTPAVDNSAASESIKQPESPKYSTEDFKVISRCWFCGVNNSSHVPFEYFDYKFCSMKCLKSHREQQQQQKIAQSNKK